jgi:thioredoxin 1
LSLEGASALVESDQDLCEVLARRGRVMALFYASWCPYCVRFLPIFQKSAEKAGLSFVIVQDDQETIAPCYSVKVYPTVLFFNNGAISKRLDGASGIGLNEKQLAEFVDLASLP